ncbi:hypothetical protein EJB05_23752, partial [Eragrostis curvula]
MAVGRDYSSLPAELLEDISGRLSADTDRLHIHQVCAHWRASTSHLTTCRPWIIAGREPRQESSCHGAPAGLPCCCGASPRWLALADCARSPTRLVLWEPVSGAQISLPPLPAVAQVFLSDDPLASPSSGGREPEGPGLRHGSEALLLAIRGPRRRRRLVSAARAPHHQDRQRGVHCHRGRAYFVHKSWQLHIFDLDASSPPRLVRDTFLFLSAAKVFRSPERLVPRRHALRTLHVVPCGGECLLVLTYAGGGAARRGVQGGGLGRRAARGGRGEGHGPRRALPVRGPRRRVRALGGGVPGCQEELPVLR